MEHRTEKRPNVLKVRNKLFGIVAVRVSVRTVRAEAVDRRFGVRIKTYNISNMFWPKVA